MATCRTVAYLEPFNQLFAYSGGTIKSNLSVFRKIRVRVDVHPEAQRRLHISEQNGRKENTWYPGRRDAGLLRRPVTSYE